MKLNHTNMYNNCSLYFDIIYFTSNNFLKTKKSVKIRQIKLINYLVKQSPIIIGKNKKDDIGFAIKDIYKYYHKNNRKRTKILKLSIKNLKRYLLDHDINIGGI